MLKRSPPQSSAMKGKDFLTLGDMTVDDLNLVLAASEALKRGRRRGLGGRLLQGKTVALVFEKPSTRTRVSFQVAVSEMGGSALSLGSSEMQLGRGETIEDTARVLSRYVHAIMARVNRHADIERLAGAASVPVINGLSDRAHPVQILADLLAIREHRGKLKGQKVAWVGDGNNVCNSWMIGAAICGMNFVAATPERYGPNPGALEEARRVGRSTGAVVSVVRDPRDAVKGADVVMTDTFVSMGFDSERESRLREFIPKYQVNSGLLALAKEDAIFEHCLPAHRGEEVTSDVIDGPQSVVFDEAENRLHTSKALLCFLVRGQTETRRLVKA